MSDPLLLAYKKPAEHWTAALPIGNGRMGAMHFGGVQDDLLQLNEETLWSGKFRDWNNPAARDAIQKIRTALKAGDYHQADELSQGAMGPWTESYLPLGNLHLHFPDFAPTEPKYRRKLYLDDAVASMRFVHQGVIYRREIFASFPDQVIVVRLSADQPGKLNLTARSACIPAARSPGNPRPIFSTPPPPPCAPAATAAPAGPWPGKSISGPASATAITRSN